MIPQAVTVAGMELVDMSTLVWPDDTYIRVLYQWPIATAAGRLAIALAWPALRMHHGEIIRWQRNHDRSVRA